MYIAKDISYSVKGKSLLKNFSSSIIPGNFTAVVGANGAGKSTTLKILTGETRGFLGEVLVNKKNIKSIDVKELACCRAVLSQNVQLQFPYSVLEVVMLGGINQEIKEEYLKAKAFKQLFEVGMHKMKNRQFLSLSGGEQQKVHLARVLTQISNPISSPKYLFLDEPTSALDMAYQHLILGKVSGLCKENDYGVMAVLHDLNLAAQYADKIIFLKEGKVVAQGSIKETFTKEIIQETFDYPVNLQLNLETGNPMVVPVSFSNKKTAKIINHQTKSINYEFIYS